MLRFEIDPTFAEQAIREGRRLTVEVFQANGRWCHRVVVGQPSSYPKREAAAMAMRVPKRA